MLNGIKDNLLLEYALTQFADHTKVNDRYKENGYNGYDFDDVKFIYESKHYKCGIESIQIKDKFNKEELKKKYYFICFHTNDKWKLGKRAFEFNLKEIDEVYPLQVSRLISAINAGIKDCKLPVKEIA